MTAPPQTLEVRITREFDAPIDVVFRAWTVPAEIAAWYGPAAFDTPEETVRVDLRVGGRYELTMVRRDTGDEMPAHTATLMAQPVGRWLVLGVGVAFLAAAVHQGRLALGRYRKKLKPYRLPEWAQPAVGPVVGFGLMARGLVFAIVGGFLVQAARLARPQEAKGLAGALGTLLVPPAGPWVLGLVAAGLAAYGVFNLLMARYRSIRP